MATPANNIQLQRMSDENIRPTAEEFVRLYNKCKQIKSRFDDSYAALTGGTTWTDSRTDGPAHLNTPSDLLAFNTIMTGFIAFMEGGLASDMTAAAAQVPVIKSMCINN